MDGISFEAGSHSRKGIGILIQKFIESSINFLNNLLKKNLNQNLIHELFSSQ